MCSGRRRGHDSAHGPSSATTNGNLSTIKPEPSTALSRGSAHKCAFYSLICHLFVFILSVKHVNPCWRNAANSAIHPDLPYALHFVLLYDFFTLSALPFWSTGFVKQYIHSIVNDVRLLFARTQSLFIGWHESIHGLSFFFSCKGGWYASFSVVHIPFVFASVSFRFWPGEIFFFFFLHSASLALIITLAFEKLFPQSLAINFHSLLMRLLNGLIAWEELMCMRGRECSYRRQVFCLSFR